MADDVGFRCATDRSEDVSDSRVLAIAERAHSISVDPGTELTEVSRSQGFGMRRDVDGSLRLLNRLIHYLAALIVMGID